jgi:AcrR family transcriptional regulator
LLRQGPGHRGTLDMVTQAKIATLVLPAKQARSRMRRDQLLAAGRELLNRGAFEATSIGDIAREAGCSVGAFYQRFPDKEAFFFVVVEAVMADIAADAERFVSAESIAKASIELALAECAKYWAQTYRRYRGFFRTVIKKTIHSEATWDPVRQMGPSVVEPFIAMLAAKCGKSESNSFYYRASAAFQLAFGVMLNASLHRTVLLNLNSDELVDWITEIFRHCLFDELPPALLKHGSGLRPSKSYQHRKSPGRNRKTRLIGRK